MPTFSQWQAQNYPAGDGPPDLGRMGPPPRFHDELDAARSQARTPDAQYPEGYLGTIESRRQDRLKQGMNQRANQKPNERGIHKGTQLEGSDYAWPEGMGPDSALVAQFEGRKWVAPGVMAEAGGMLPDPAMARVGGQGNIPTNQPTSADPRLRLPPWSPGMAVPNLGR